MIKLTNKGEIKMKWNKNFNIGKTIILIGFCIVFNMVNSFSVSAAVSLERNTNPSQETLDYIENHLIDFVHIENVDNIDTSNVYIGQPFDIYDKNSGKLLTTKYPVYNNGKCIGIGSTFKTKKTGEYTTTLSFESPLIDLLNTLYKKQGQFKIVNNSDLNTFEVVLSNEGSKNFNQDERLFTISRTSIKDENLKRQFSVRSANYPDYMKLPLSVTETQTTKPWCAAYAAALILSYEFSTDIRAYDLMKWAHTHWWNPNPDLDQLSLSHDQIIAYARTLGSAPYKVNRSLYREEIMEEISNYRMIYAGTHREDDSSIRHAIVVYGYEKDKWYYFWNPWGRESFSSMDTDEIETNDGKFWWDSSIRNFTW